MKKLILFFACRKYTSLFHDLKIFHPLTTTTGLNLATFFAIPED